MIITILSIRFSTLIKIPFRILIILIYEIIIIIIEFIIIFCKSHIKDSFKYFIIFIMRWIFIIIDINIFKLNIIFNFFSESFFYCLLLYFLNLLAPILCSQIKDTFYHSVYTCLFTYKMTKQGFVSITELIDIICNEDSILTSSMPFNSDFEEFFHIIFEILLKNILDHWSYSTSKIICWSFDWSIKLVI